MSGTRPLQVMQSSNDHAVLTVGDGKKEAVTRSTCEDFVYFRQLLRQARRPDDNINHQLNKIDVNSKFECNRLYERMAMLHQERADALQFCQEQMKLGIDAEADPAKKRILAKEVYKLIFSFIIF